MCAKVTKLGLNLPICSMEQYLSVTEGTIDSHHSQDLYRKHFLLIFLVKVAYSIAYEKLYL